MAYRDDVDALVARRDALREQLDERGVLEEVAALADLEDRLRRARALRLQDARIASPCSATWEAMDGEGPVRKCHGCDKNVYDLAGMTTEEALRMIERREQTACVRLHRRADGTVLTSDCPVGRGRFDGRGVALAGGALLSAVAFSVAAGPALDESFELPIDSHVEGVVMGAIVMSEPGAQGPFKLDEDVYLHGEPVPETWPEPRLVVVDKLDED